MPFHPQLEYTLTPTLFWRAFHWHQKKHFWPRFPRTAQGHAPNPRKPRLAWANLGKRGETWGNLGKPGEAWGNLGKPRISRIPRIWGMSLGCHREPGPKSVFPDGMGCHGYKIQVLLMCHTKWWPTFTSECSVSLLNLNLKYFLYFLSFLFSAFLFSIYVIEQKISMSA